MGNSSASKGESDLNQLIRSQQTTNFLPLLFKNCHLGHIQFRFISQDRTEKPIIKYVPLERLNDLPCPPSNRNCYFSVATRKCGGTKNHIVQIPALWVDIDFKQVQEEEADKRLLEFPLKSSVLIATGGGYHCYWILTKPATQDDISVIENLLKRLTFYLSGGIWPRLRRPGCSGCLGRII